jgi:hypothetical protein
VLSYACSGSNSNFEATIAKAMEDLKTKTPPPLDAKGREKAALILLKST